MERNPNRTQSEPNPNKQFATCNFHKRERNITLSVGVRGSYPEPAEAKLTPVINSSILSDEFKYGGTSSFIPTYLAATKHRNKY